jgi:hypothetical protein
MRMARLFFREQSLTKVAAMYRDATRAIAVAQALRRLPRMHDGQVQVVHPYDRDWGRKLEPEGVGIWRTAVRAHLTCGAIGLFAGAAVFAGFYLFGVRAITATPLAALFAMVLFATMFGLMIGGVLTVRPDHDAIVDAVRQAAKAGLWTVIVHPVSREQRAAVERSLQATGAPIARTWYGPLP